MRKLCTNINFLAIVLVMLLLARCYMNSPASYSERLHPDTDDGLGGTGVDPTDVRTIAQRMARDIIALPQVANAGLKPRILILPVLNRTRFRIETDVFTLTIRDLLIQNASDKVVFFDRKASSLPSNILKGESEDVKKSGFTKEQIAGIDFYLKGEIYSISKASEQGVSDWIHYSFILVDSKNSDIIWSGSYETKKVGKAGVLYQ